MREQARSLLGEIEMMNIELRKTDKSPFYQARFYINGKQQERSTKETNKRLARKVAENIVYDLLARSKYPQTIGAHTFEEAVQRRLDEGISKNDERYLNWFREEIGDLLLSEIDKDLIWKLKQKYKKQRKAKNQSINRAFTILNGTLSKCVLWDWLEQAPKDLKLKASTPKKRRCLKKNEITDIKKVSMEIGKPYLFDIIHFYLLTGFRKEELIWCENKI